MSKFLTDAAPELAELDQVKTAKAYIRETKKGWQVEAAA